MPSARLRLSETWGSLRFRLTVWNTAVVLILIVLSLWGLRESFQFILFDEADRQLADDAQEVALIYEQNWPDLDTIHRALDRKALTHTHRGLHLRIFDAQRKLIWTSADNAPAQPFSTDYIDQGFKPITAGAYRLIHIQTSKPGVPVVTLRVGISLEPLEGDLAKITRLLLIVGSVSLLVSPLGGFWLAERATRPIAQIIDTADRLRPTSLEERLPLRGTRDELDRLSHTINGLLDRIAVFLQQNREFTASAAHELRSPLAAIQNSLEVALNSDRSIDEYKELLGEVLDECSGLRTLINQLLLLAESDAGGLQIRSEPVALDQVVQTACDMFSGVAEATNVRLIVGPLHPTRVGGEAGRLRQVINNLLDNAVKYTRPGGTVTVTLAENASEGLVQLQVHDTGVGISAVDFPHIFDRFFRGDRSRQRDRRTRGLGLGLAICQSIVAAHQGRIHLDSVVDCGTTVTVTLPTIARAHQPLNTPESGLSQAVPAERVVAMPD